MNQKSSEYISRQILEENGAEVADKAKVILLEDSELKELREPLEFISKNWRDLTPALMSLSCEAVGGKPEETKDVALAMCLMNLSLTIWDDIIDNARSKSFKPTVFGKFGEGPSIIIGGVASAKAFIIFSRSRMDRVKKEKISKLIWKLWSKMATEELITFKIRAQGLISSNEKFNKIKSEGIDLATLLKIGAIIGNGSNDEIKHLYKCGQCLAIILALRQDLQVSLNLTLELAEKIKNNRLPYSILWANEHSSILRAEFESLREKSTLNDLSVKKFVECFLDTGICNHITEKIEEFKKMGECELGFIPPNSAANRLNHLLTLDAGLFP